MRTTFIQWCEFEIQHYLYSVELFVTLHEGITLMYADIYSQYTFTIQYVVYLF